MAKQEIMFKIPYSKTHLLCVTYYVSHSFPISNIFVLIPVYIPKIPPKK